MNKETIARILFSIDILVFFVYILFWVYINQFVRDENLSNLFSDSYGLVALFGALSGFAIFGLWGGFKSKLGNSIFWFSVGLLFQFLGQLVSTYYRRILGVDAPYPSFAELFYFSSIFIYLFAVYMLSHLAGVKQSIKLSLSRILVILTPLLLILVAYNLFLSNYDFSASAPLAIFLDFAYPISQAVQISMALLTFLLIVRSMGGLLKLPAVMLIVALFLQYFADTYFTYRYIHYTVYPGGVSDSLYLLAYFVMGVAIYMFLDIYNKLNVKNA